MSARNSGDSTWRKRVEESSHRGPDQEHLQQILELPRSPQFGRTDRSHARSWVREKGLWWATSITAHALILSIVMLVAGAMYVAPKVEGEAPQFDSADVDTTIPEVENFEVGDTPIDPTELNTDTLSLEAPTVTEQVNTSADDPFSEAGGGATTPNPTTVPGLGGLDLKAIGAGPALKGPGGLGGGNGEGKGVGTGSKGTGFGGRGTGVRKAMLGSGGGTKQSERAVAAALNWLARHQNADGGWSLGEYPARCKDATCTGAGTSKSDTAATAFALLPFLAAGQTHLTKGPYQKNIAGGIYFLTSHQKNDGDYTGSGYMYSHGLASIAMCEAYGLSGDKSVGQSAQMAIHFIERAQNPQTSGWHYAPLGTGDTSVFGWQVMAAQSAQMAGLSVSSQTMAGVSRWLKSVGNGNGGFTYTPPGGIGSPAMNAVGLLCTQYHGAPRQDPADCRRHGLLDGPHARRSPPRHLLLVLCHAGDAQPARLRVGHLESQDSQDPDREPGDQGMRRRQLGLSTPFEKTRTARRRAGAS